MNDADLPERVVYDCNVYLQRLLNYHGPNGRCVELALNRVVRVYVSDAVFAELRTLPAKPIAIDEGVTSAVVEALIVELQKHGVFIADVPTFFDHPIDPDDAAYVNLAIAADAKLIVSRDKHLLNLTNPAKPWSADFRARFPSIRVMRPDEFLAERARVRE